MTAKLLRVISCLMILLTGCQSQNGPRFINHPQPEMPEVSDLTVFEAGGCPRDEYGGNYCNPISPVGVSGCTLIYEPPELTGGLDPSFPLATCHVQESKMNAGTRAEVEGGKYLREVFGALHGYIRYVIYRDGRYVPIKTTEEFQAIFAPITSKEEALSYVLALTNLSAYYGLEYHEGYEYKADVIEDAKVTRTLSGYHLHLFSYERLGCGQHWTSAVEVNLTRQGVIEEVSRREIFRDPRQEGNCAD